MQTQPRKINEVYSICDHKMLGKGSTGNVYLGFLNSQPDRKVAIKSIDLSTVNNQVTRYLLSCQIAALSNLGKIERSGHENIVKLIQIVIERNFLYMVMELLEGGTLAQYIKQHPNGLPEEQALHIFRQIIQGYQHIRAKKIVHRDLKPDNILFKRNPNQTKQIAIIDFGYCQMEEVPNKPQCFYNVGSPKYMSPEAYTQNRYSEKSDIWAIGVMLYEMLVGFTCDKGMTMEAYLDMIEHKGVPIPQKMKMFHQHLLSTMLQYDHRRRVGCEHVLKELQLNMQSLTKQKSVIELRNTTNTEQAVKGKPMLFHSVIVPSNKQATAIPGKGIVVEKQLRSETKLKQPDENGKESPRKETPRVNGFSFHVQQVKPQEGNQILGKVQNIDLLSAKQIIHRRNVEPVHENKVTQPSHPQQLIQQIRQMRNSQLRRQSQGKMIQSQPVKPQNEAHPQKSQHQAYPQPQSHAQHQGKTQVAMIGMTSTPQAQQVTSSTPHFISNQRQMTPIANQTFQIPVQNAQKINFNQNQNTMIIQRGTIHNQPIPNHQVHNIQSVRDALPNQIKIVKPPSPTNVQVTNIQRPEKVAQSPEKRPQQMTHEMKLSENRYSMQELSPQRRIKMTVNTPPLIETQRQFDPNLTRKDEKILVSPVKTDPVPQQIINHHPETQRRPFNTQVNRFFDNPPEMIIHKQENRHNIIRIAPQNIRQLDGRVCHQPQGNLTLIRQPVHQ